MLECLKDEAHLSDDSDENEVKAYQNIDVPYVYSFRQFYNVYKILSKKSPFGIKVKTIGDDLGDTRMELKDLTEEVK